MFCFLICFYFIFIFQKKGGNLSQLNFDPNGNGMSVLQSLHLFGELKSMSVKDNNLYCK